MLASTGAIDSIKRRAAAFEGDELAQATVCKILSDFTSLTKNLLIAAITLWEWATLAWR